MNPSDEQFDWDKRLLARWSSQIKIMPINLINGFGPEIPIRPASTRPTTTAGSNAGSFDTTEFTSVRSQPTEVRPEKIARAQALLADESYPSEKALKQLAGFLTEKL
jgi:hypothetical protein